MTSKMIRIGISGSTGVLGSILLRKLKKKNYKVSCFRSDIRKIEKIQSWVKKIIVDNKGSAIVIKADISNFTEVKKAFRQIIKEYGRIDFLINNASVTSPIGKILDTDPYEWKKNIEVNLIGGYNMIRACIDFFLQQKHGVIVNVSSGAAHKPIYGWSAYCSGKAGAAMLTQSLHKEYSAHGIYCLGIDPGMTYTNMQKVIRESKINNISKVPREKLANPLIPAKVISYLVRKKPAIFAGKELHVRDDAIKQLMKLS